MMKLGPQKFARATFLRDRALEMVHRHGTVPRIGNAGIGKECARTGFSVFYSVPRQQCDEYYHLDIRADRRSSRPAQLQARENVTSSDQAKFVIQPFHQHPARARLLS
jgi:hypothetical protein